MSKRLPSVARSADEPYRLGDLMRLFGYADENSFRAWRVRVEALGFPPPLPGCKRPLKWDRALVDAWRLSGGRPAQRALAEQQPAAAPVDELAAHRAKLAAKAAQRAAG